MFTRYVVRRLLLLIPVIIGVTFLVFLLTNLAPGDPVMVMLGPEYNPITAAQMREELGLDKPLLEQYVRWLGRAARLDLGKDFITKRSVAEQIQMRLPTTILLSLGSMIIAIGLGVPIGVVSATRRNSWIDNLGRIVAMLGVSMPVFWVGMLLIIAFAVNIRWFPAGGSVEEYGPIALVLPCAGLGASFAALIMRTTRASMLEVLSQDYVRTARAKGLSDAAVDYFHALTNALIPVVTVIGLQFGHVLSGAVLTETIFTLPGLGRLLVDAVARRDYPLIQGCVLVIALIFVFVNLLVDLLYHAIDPRIRIE